MLPDEFFKACERESSPSKTYLTNEHKGFVLNEKWKLYAPSDLKALLNKGVSDYEAV